MSSWDDLYDLIRQVERTLFRLKMDQSAPTREVLRDEEAGWYTRGYLIQRLPAEIARSRKTGRPFGVALLCAESGAQLTPSRWRSFLSQHLDPIEVAVLYGERELCFLFPELDAAATRFRLIELAEKASLAGLVSFASTVVSFLSYPNVQASPGALLARLEEGLMPLAALTFERDSATGELAQEGVGRTEAIASTQEAGSRHEAGARHEADSGHEAGSRQDGPQDPSDGDLAPTNRPGSRANEARVPAPGGEGRVPAAVGFAADRTLPVSFWFRGELYTIQAVLEGGMEGEDGQRLTVMTQTGIFRLEREGQRWYAQKLD